MSALFAGDIALDCGVVAARIPASDEKIETDRAYLGVGGVVCNAALACAEFECTTDFLGRLGDDAAGLVLASLLNDGRLCWSSVETVPGSTALAVIIVDPSGEKRIFWRRGISIFPSEQQCRTVNLDRRRWLHTAMFEPRSAGILVARCSDQNVPTSLTLEPSGCEGTYARTLATPIDTLFLRRPDGLTLEAGNNLRRSCLAKHLVLTAGAAGVTLITNGAPRHIEVEPLPVVDSTGAGDVLAGSYVAYRLAGATPAEAVQLAARKAGESCQYFGAQRPIRPDR